MKAANPLFSTDRPEAVCPLQGGTRFSGDSIDTTIVESPKPASGRSGAINAYIVINSIDGRFLYYPKLEAHGLWRRSLNDGEETRILDKSGSILWYDWALARNGIYFLDTKAKPKEAIEFLDFESGKTTPVVYPDKPVIWGVSVSPGGRYVLYVQTHFVPIQSGVS